jgi:hypothetical protein
MQRLQAVDIQMVGPVIAKAFILIIIRHLSSARNPALTLFSSIGEGTFHSSPLSAAVPAFGPRHNP